jgi:hypothetical protein
MTVGWATSEDVLLTCDMFFFVFFAVVFGLDRMLLQLKHNGRWRYPRF